MSKTLVIVLNHNIPEYANKLYDSLKDFQGETYDVLVMDNGSKPDLIPVASHIRFEQNLYWGGALNEAFKMVLKDDTYDSLLFLNNDIEVTGEVFVNLLRHELFSNDFVMIHPCVAGSAQPWKQMQNWGGKETRVVKWIDLIAPMFHRKLIEEAREFPSELYFGWGQELIIYDICQEKGWKTGVCDHVCIVHYGKQTYLQQKLFVTEETENGVVERAIPISERHALAAIEYRTYFALHVLKHGNFDDLRKYGEEYTYYDALSNNKID
jgi:GT2 family glycosyltransferase